MNKFLQFNDMITPVIIKILFYVGAGISIIAGLIQMVAGFNSSFGGGFQVLLGLFIIILGPIFARVYCEILIVIFKIHEHLSIIRKHQEKQIE